MLGFFASTFTGTPVLHNVLLDQYASATHSRFMKTTTTKRIEQMTAKLTAMRKVGLSYDLPEVKALLAAINALCNAEVGQ